METENMMQPRPSARTRIPTAGLREMNPASTNARSGLMQPGTIAGAATSKSSTLSQPSRPRSTTQAPEVGRAGAGAPSRVGSSTAKLHTRANSHSTLTRSASTTTRTKGATSSAHGPPRPHTSMARTHSVASRRPHGQAIPRPATSMDTHNEEDPTASVLGKRKGTEWDQESREKSIEALMNTFMTQFNQAGQESSGLKEALQMYKSRVTELEGAQKELMETNVSLRVDLESLKSRLGATGDAFRSAQRDHEMEMDDLNSRQQIELESVRSEGRKELEALNSHHQEEIRELRRRFQHELEDQKAVQFREISQLTSQTAIDTQRVNIELDKKNREIATLQDDMRVLRAELDRERKNNRDLRHNLDTASSNSVTMESSVRALKARIEFLEGGREEQSQAFERLNQQMNDALSETNATKEKLRKEETLRRKLHNQVQELKGNIRVFCRVRPSLPSDPPTAVAQIQFPDEAEDSKEIALQGPEEKSSLGVVSRKNSNFAFDRVFGPSTQNAEVFDEISQLVQSALDGYNVCIFCYGQTGSGKTHTMSSLDGMIPRAVHQIYETARGLEEKGWRYTMEGSFVEVYNENLNDLLGNPEELDKKRLDIRHDMQRGKTIITDVTTVRLDSPEMVGSILKRAASNRSVAATKANERSSRSHSVFILKLIGENDITGERSEGTLNLVDLAGSERLSHSGATGERLKETQNINRSLSCLGDVIAALGQGKEGGHIPYRNSKLTYLLQFSLGGNSKTLMFVMVSPLQAHLSETLTSLKFATKVHNTHIGTAKRQARVRDS
ncbi:kinesin-domain-containing protein [Aspergillus heteromorphus CBS 117.55]|uniref:Kinesin-like protein n=1 Tax=Aspergillus heteromorphus CBS 117.55 TaxID=1448321 RepID=A0A317VJ38_9EURO|nr:kinesin-domain-containing protein [Aspergillus heteromorphus CBS 117.55]PWY74346.1 kinesin-domain-containing protein [Aspergillus heteromorphus CBS 117.55]